MMCTLSLARSSDGRALRVLMNRDERRLRPVAHPPAITATTTGATIWPRDPVGGGTWIAANDAGLVLALLNVDGHRTPPDSPSRGSVVPLMASCSTLDAAAGVWQAIDTTAFAPFRLVVATLHGLAVFERGVPEPLDVPLARAHVFSSSSLGDRLVEGPRREVFRDLLRLEPDPWMAQTRLHLHAWPDRRHLSAMMSRTEACTVSCTEVVLTAEDVTMAYRPIVDGWPAGATTRNLAMAARAVRAA